MGLPSPYYVIQAIKGLYWAFFCRRLSSFTELACEGMMKALGLTRAKAIVEAIAQLSATGDRFEDFRSLTGRLEALMDSGYEPNALKPVRSDAELLRMGLTFPWTRLPAPTSLTSRCD